MTSWISESFRLAIDETIATSAECCVTLESKKNSELYIQFTAEHINLAYPNSDDPKHMLDQLPKFPLCRIANWEPQSFLTLEHGVEQAVEPVGEFVSEYIERVLKLSADKSDWNVTEQTL